MWNFRIGKIQKFQYRAAAKIHTHCRKTVKCWILGSPGTVLPSQDGTDPNPVHC